MIATNISDDLIMVHSSDEIEFCELVRYILGTLFTRQTRTSYSVGSVILCTSCAESLMDEY